MKNELALLRRTLFLIAVFLSATASSAAPVAQVVKVQGNVEVRDAKGQLRGLAKAGMPLSAGDSLHASGNGVAAMRSTAGDTIVVDAGAAARVKNDRSTFEHLVGKILYLFQPNKKIDRTVKTQGAVIGIRGTTFLVDAMAEKEVIGVKRGTLKIDSTREGFNVYRRKEQDEFEAFKQEGKDAIKREQEEFDRYRAQVQEEFVAFQKSVQLQEQQSLTVAGDRATIGRLDKGMNDEIRKLEEFAGVP